MNRRYSVPGGPSMSVAAFCQAVQSHWQALTQYVWPASPEQRVQEEIARRTADLVRRYRRLVQRRRRIEALRDRLTRQERELADGAPRSAEVPLLARAGNRQRLTEQGRRYAGLRAEYVRRKQFRQALARGQVGVCDIPPAPEERSGAPG